MPKPSQNKSEIAGSAYLSLLIFPHNITENI